MGCWKKEFEMLVMKEMQKLLAFLKMTQQYSPSFLALVVVLSVILSCLLSEHSLPFCHLPLSPFLSPPSTHVPLSQQVEFE